MLKVAIVDDEPLAGRRLISVLKAFDDVQVVGIARNTLEARQLVNDARPDLVLLDIKMPGRSGLQFAEELRQGTSMPEIVFVTAFSRFAVEAFGVAALDYLVKPVEPDRLREALDRARLQRRLKIDVQKSSPAASPEPAEQPQPRLFFKSDKGARFIEIGDIAWIKAERDFVRVYTDTRNYFFRANMTDLIEKLADHGFIRVHRSAIVARTAVEAVVGEGRNFLVLTKGGHRISISRRASSAVRNLLAAAGICP